MPISRRRLLQGATLLPLARLDWSATAFAQGAGSRIAAGDAPPIVFAHGNGDQAALWITTLWRFESNGVAPGRLHAFNFSDPLARSADGEPQPNRSSTADQLRELAAVVDAVKQRTGSPKVALVGSSRGGYAIRNYVQLAGGNANVSHVVLCGVPNHGVFDWEFNAGSEFNGRGPFLRELNAREGEPIPGVAIMTLRSDGNDKFALPDGRFVGRPGTPTGITAEGPELRGATNVVLGQLDHREVAFHPRAFREMFRFIVGREPARLAIVPEAQVRLEGLVTGLAGAAPTNRPVAGASLTVWRVSGETGERLGEPLYRHETQADGAWGPITVEPTAFLEFVLAAPGAPIAHYYRSPFPRSSSVVHLRPGRALGQADAGAGSVVVMARPRGYFGLPRDVLLLDGREPKDVPHGVAGESGTTARLPTAEVGRPVVALFNEERIVARAWPAAENRIVIAELTY
jgi:pimeloyl-ACP methyl ester carboxylesterase